MARATSLGFVSTSIALPLGMKESRNTNICCRSMMRLRNKSNRYRNLTRLRHKQRKRCAWIPSRRGRCESDRGAPESIFSKSLWAVIRASIGIYVLSGAEAESQLRDSFDQVL